LPRRLPPLNALRAFEAAARHLSFTKAAEELFVTQAAVSHQVKALEEHLGMGLFRRLNRRLMLTDAGQAYLPALRDAFDGIERATRRLSVQESDNAIRVTTMEAADASGQAAKMVLSAANEVSGQSQTLGNEVDGFLERVREA